MFNDKEINISFQINFDTHGKMYMYFGNNILVIEEINGIKYEEIDKNKKEEYEKKYFFAEKNLDYNKYLSNIEKNSFEKNKLIFIYNKQKLSLYSFGNIILVTFGENIRMLSFSFIKKNIKFFGLKPIKKDSEGIKNFLLKKIGDENKKFLEIFYEKTDISKIQNIF